MPYIIKKSTLTGIADAIRGKTGGTDKMNPVEMASAIEGISAGGGDISEFIDGFIDGSLEADIVSDVTEVRDYAFYNCDYLKSIKLPLVTSMGSTPFKICSRLQTVDFSQPLSFPYHTFGQCSMLTALVLRAETMSTMESTSALYMCLRFYGTYNAVFNPDALKDAYIYVPRALVDSYKSATNWATFADQIRALEDYTVDGTITGELDETKI